jgi:hypothetical protein
MAAFGAKRKEPKQEVPLVPGSFPIPRGGGKFRPVSLGLPRRPKPPHRRKRVPASLQGATAIAFVARR